MKICFHCKIEKELNEFQKNKCNKDGLQDWCRLCLRDKQRKYYLLNRDKIHARRRAIYAQRIQDPAYKAKMRQKDAKRVDKRNAWYERNRETILEKQRIWYYTLDGKYHAYKNGARHRKLEWALTKEDFQKYFWQQPCYYCGDPIETVGIDRKINKVGYILTNCVPCCTTCNMEYKGDKDINVFLGHIRKIVERIQ